MIEINGVRYGRPNLMNMPEDLGRAIFKQMLETPPVDDEAMQAESDRFMKEFLKMRKQEMEQGE